MTDAGMLDPIVDGILKKVGVKPTRIVIGTSLLALLVHLDGSGAVTFLITIPIMLPLYQQLKMDKRVLACAASLSAGVNFLPWTGPMIQSCRSITYTSYGHFQSADPSSIGGYRVRVCNRIFLGQERRKQYRRRVFLWMRFV